MRFGVFSNHVRSHPRRGRIVANVDINASWDEDIREIVAADRLGFEEAWISEHTAFWMAPDALASAEMLIAKLSTLTTQIRLGPAVRRIALLSPAQLAMETAVCDHLTDGRYMLGFGHGGLITGYEQRGIALADSHAMMLENIELAIRMMTEVEPFDYEGPHYRGEKIAIYPKPLQQPYPPVAMASNQAVLARWAADHDFRFLLSQTARAQRMRELGDAYAQRSIELSGGSRRSNLIATRAVHVAPTDEQALAEVDADLTEHLETNVAGGRGNTVEFVKGTFSRSPLMDEWVPEGGTLDDITLQYALAEGLYFVGSPETVTRKITAFYEASGGFGTFLLVMGKDQATADQRERSLELFAQQVAPALRGLDPDAESGRPLQMSRA